MVHYPGLRFRRTVWSLQRIPQPSRCRRHVQDGMVRSNSPGLELRMGHLPCTGRTNLVPHECTPGPPTIGYGDTGCLASVSGTYQGWAVTTVAGHTPPEVQAPSFMAGLVTSPA